MAGNVTGLHQFQNDVGPIPLALLDTNYSALAVAFNTLGNFSNFYIDVGTLNALNVQTATTQFVSYTDGLRLLVRVANTVTSGQPTLNVNNLGPVVITNGDGSAIGGGQITAGSIVTLTFNQPRNRFELLMGGGGGGSSGNLGSARVGPSGEWYIGPPTSALSTLNLFAPVGNGALTVDGGGPQTQAGIWAAQIWAGGAAGQAPGFANALRVNGGTNANDQAFAVWNAPASAGAASTTQFMGIRGDGSGWLGAFASPGGTDPPYAPLVWSSNGWYAVGPPKPGPYVAFNVFASVNNTGFWVVDAAHTQAGVFNAIIGGGNAPAGFSNGLSVRAGTNANDVAFNVQNSAGALTFFQINGDGSGWLGPSAANALHWSNVGTFSTSGTASLPGGGTGGSNALSQLTDVSVSNMTSGQVLTWNSGVSRWINSGVPTPPPPSLAQLTGVSITSPVANQVLTFNGTAWINAAPTGGGGAANLGIATVDAVQGDWTFNIPNAPSTHTTVVMKSPANNMALALENGAANTVAGNFLCNMWAGGVTGQAAGLANGLGIHAGTNANDQAFAVWNGPASSGGASTLQFMSIRGDGSGFLGPAAGKGISWDINGNVMFTLPAATAGGQWYMQLGPSTPASPAGMSNGLQIYAGTNAQDAALSVFNEAAGAEFFHIRGDGSGWIGPSAANCLTWNTTGGFSTLGTATLPGGGGGGTVTPPVVWTDTGALGAGNPILRLTTLSGGQTWAQDIICGTGGTTAVGGQGLRIQAGSGTDAATSHCFLVQSLGYSFNYLAINQNGAGQLGPNNTNFMSWDTSANYRLVGSANLIAPNMVGPTVIAQPSAATSGAALTVNSGGVAGAWGLIVGVGAGHGLGIQGGTGTANLMRAVDSTWTTSFFQIASTGSITMAALLSSASAANVYRDATGILYGSTSARRYKTNIRAVTRKKARDVVKRLRAVTFRSLCEGDDPKQNYYGLVAEDVAAVDPGLVNFDKDGKPSGVQYERVLLMLLPLMQELLDGTA
jgi:hypothetical protein